MTIVAMLLSGALAGLRRRQRDAWACSTAWCSTSPPAHGFAGIAVALMGRNHPLGIVLAALLFGALLPGRRRARLRHARITPRHGRRDPGPGDPVLRRARSLSAAVARSAVRAAARRMRRVRMDDALIVVLHRRRDPAGLDAADPRARMAGLFSERSRHHRYRARRQDADGGLRRRRGRRRHRLGLAGLAAASPSPWCWRCCTALPASPIAAIRWCRGVAINILASGLTVVLGTPGSSGAARRRR